MTTLGDLADLPPTLTVEDAAEILDVGRSAAYAACRRGEIPTLRLGRRILVPTARLLAMIGVEHGRNGTEPNLSPGETPPSPDIPSGEDAP